MSRYFDSARFFDALLKIFPYLSVTFQIVLVATIAGCALGLLIAVTRIRRIPVLYQIATVFISFMRGTPLLVQMMLSYYGIPVLLRLIGIETYTWDKIIFADIAYALNQAAFLSEMFRGAMEAVPKGQREAALSVGLTGFQAFYRIVLPQAWQIVLPSFSVDFVSLFQGTSLVYLLGILDLMGRAKSVGTFTGHFLEAYLAAICIYVSISLLVRAGFRYLSGRAAYRGDK